MCGGLMIASKATRLRPQVLYHTGRLIGYTALGALLGHVGSFVVFQNSQDMQTIVAIITAGLLILFSFAIWSGRPLHLSIPFLNRFTTFVQTRLLNTNHVAVPFLVGLFTSGLPCGWLYVYLLGAANTGTATYGALYMVFFWLGTLPALSAFGLFGNTILSPITQKFPKVSAILLFVIGCYSIFSRF